MNNYNKKFSSFGLSVPEILVPNKNINPDTWGVIAVDQFTSDLDYWIEAEKKVGSALSTLRLVLPEIYLDKEDTETRIASITETMKRYSSDGTLQNIGEGFILVKRSTGLSDPLWTCCIN